MAGLLVLVGAILIGKWAFTGGGGGDDSIKAPNFVGEKLADAKQSAKNVDLVLDASTHKPCEKYPKGEICSQDPGANATVKKGDTISVTVSTGAPKVSVPKVIGLDIDAATKKLESPKYQFDVDTKPVESSGTPDEVLDQDPFAGTDVEKGSKITLEVAKKADKATVPDVTGKTCDEAKAQLQTNDLVGTCEEEESDSVDPGKVISQSLPRRARPTPARR